MYINKRYILKLAHQTDWSSSFFQATGFTATEEVPQAAALGSEILFKSFHCIPSVGKKDRCRCM